MMIGGCARPATRRALNGALALRRAPLFRGVGDRDLAEIEAAARRITYARNDAIRARGGARDEVVVLARGTAALCGVADDGEDIFFEFVRAGDIFGFTPCEARVLTPDAVAYHLPHALIRRLMATTPAVGDYVHELLCHRLAQAGTLIVALARYDTPTRLARLLAHLADADGDEIALTQDDLGAFVGARQARVSLAIATLQAQGLVARRRGAIVVLDRARLATYPDGSSVAAGETGCSHAVGEEKGEKRGSIRYRMERGGGVAL